MKNSDEGRNNEYYEIILDSSALSGKPLLNNGKLPSRRSYMDLEYKIANGKYSVSHMSNSKWFKLFSAWSELEIEVSYWRFIDSNHEEVHSLPKMNDLLHDRFADGRFQPFEYKWILSIFIPRKYKPKLNVGFEQEQDVDKLKQIADSLGKFPILETENGIEIRGYEE